MGRIAQVARKLKLLFGREKFNRELEEEMAFHREQTEQDLLAEGMPAAEARFAAKRQFGNEARLKDQSQQVIGVRGESILQDLKFALRQLKKNPGFTVTVILILTLGICASVAIFGFVDAALIKPLPYLNPSRLAVLYESNPLGSRFHLSYLDYLDWKKSNRTFSSLDIYANDGFMLSAPTRLQQVDGTKVSAGFFHTLGVVPVLGRDFHTDEDSASSAGAVLLSYAAFQKRYGGGPDVLGKTVTLDGIPHTIIGVLPPDYHFAPADPSEFWTTLSPSGGCEKNRGCHDYYGIARLEDGVTFAFAFADIKAIAQQLEKQYPDANGSRGAFMLPLTEVIVGDIRPVLLVLLSGAGLLLLIACVNVASLLMVRSESRRREIAVRGALGASRARLVRQFVTEGLLLSLSGSALGVACAALAMRMLVRLIPISMMESMPYLQRLGLNARVATFAGVVTLLMSVFFALTPTLRMFLSDMREGLTEGGRSSSGRLWRRFGANLVIVELTIAVVLLACAGLLGKSFYRLLHVDIGLQPDHLAALQIAATGTNYSKDEPQIALEQEVERKISSLPGVKSVAIANHLPLGDGDGTTNFRIAGHPYKPGHDEAAYRSVSPAYFSTLKTTLLRGRYFAEDKSKPLVVVINRELARLYFPGENPVGKQMYPGDDLKSPPIEIIGVVDDIQEGQLDAAPRAAIYVPFRQSPSNYFAVIARTGGDEQQLLPTMTSAMHSIDSNIATFGAITISERIHDSPSAYLHRSSAWIVGGFAALALLLSVVGLYGVIAYSVSQRTREIGVRMALGAQRSAVYRLILSEAGRLAVAGIGAGVLCSLAATMLIRKLLFDVHAWDASILASVALALAASALLASYLPARRAASVNPTEALHAE